MKTVKIQMVALYLGDVLVSQEISRYSAKCAVICRDFLNTMHWFRRVLGDNVLQVGPGILWLVIAAWVEQLHSRDEGVVVASCSLCQGFPSFCVVGVEVQKYCLNAILSIYSCGVSVLFENAEITLEILDCTVEFRRICRAADWHGVSGGRHGGEWDERNGRGRNDGW